MSPGEGEASARLRAEVRTWAARLKVEPRRVRLQRMRRKWASCSSRKTLTFALDLIDEPSSFRRYVIVHELLHLKVPNHGRLFKAMLSVYVPGWHRLAKRSGLP